MYCIFSFYNFTYGHSNFQIPELRFRIIGRLLFPPVTAHFILYSVVWFCVFCDVSLRQQQIVPLSRMLMEIICSKSNKFTLKNQYQLYDIIYIF